MSTFLLYTLGFLAFVVALLVSIGLHELGHMVPAKRFGAKVTQYFIGFGPTVWSRQRGETEYGLKLIPLGGFVRIVGMMPPEKGHFEGKLRESNTGLFTGLIASAKKMEYETITEEDRPRLFYKLPWWRKVIVMAGGPSVNIVLAFLAFAGTFAFLGERVYEPASGTPTLAYVVPCVEGKYGETVAPAPDGTCGAGEASPAAQAGLQSGDRVLAVDGRAMASWEELVAVVRNTDRDRVLTFEVERDDRVLTVPVEPVTVLRPDGTYGTVRAGFLGASPLMEETFVRRGPVYTLQYMGDRTWETVVALKDVPPKLYNVFLALSGVEERDPNGPVSIVGGARFSGEIASYENGSIPGVEISREEKIAAFFMLVGASNLFLGVANLIPILPLDGGHIAAALWEGLKRGVARILRLPPPKPADVSKMLPIAYAAGLMLFLAGLLLIAADLLVPLQLMG